MYVRFLLRACLHDVRIVSSNKATLKIPVLAFGVNPSPENDTTARPATPSLPLDPSAATRSGSHSGSDKGSDDDGSRREEEDGEEREDQGEETNSAENGASAAKGFRSDGTASAVPQVWSEGRTAWKGETLKALRTPLFVVEITVVGEKGGEAFAYTQRLSAVKESALTLIDKAIASTQVSFIVMTTEVTEVAVYMFDLYLFCAHFFYNRAKLRRRTRSAQVSACGVRLTKPKSEIILSVSLDRVVVLPLSTQNMVRVERRVMKKLFWSHDPVMSSVYASESWVQHLRDTVGTALERAVAPAAEYLKTLEPFVEFLNIDGEPLRCYSREHQSLLWRP